MKTLDLSNYRIIYDGKKLFIRRKGASSQVVLQEEETQQLMLFLVNRDIE